MPVKLTPMLIALLALLLLLAGCNRGSPTAPDWPTPTPEILEEPTNTPEDDPFEIIIPTVPDQTGPDGVSAPTLDLSLPPTAIPAGTDTGGTDSGDPMPEDADAALFPDTYSEVSELQLRAGQTLIVNYDVQINNPDRGRVFVIVRDPAGEIIWRAMFSATVQASADVPIDTTGTYQVAGAFQNLSGTYELSYDIRSP